MRKGCEQAFGLPDELRRIPGDLPDDEKAELRRQASEWRKQHCWHPHRLRHSAATSIRREFGIEAARVVLGHASAGITETYVEIDFDKAREVMAKIG